MFGESKRRPQNQKSTACVRISIKPSNFGHFPKPKSEKSERSVVRTWSTERTKSEHR